MAETEKTERTIAPIGSKSAVPDEAAAPVTEPSEPAPMMGDEDSLRLLATNLVDNAIRYGRRGGHVEVSTWREGASSILQVCDDGPGIAPAERERVFDRFYRGAAEDAAGSGLGLAIVRQVAAMHEARVELADGLDGRGLCARFVARAAS